MLRPSNATPFTGESEREHATLYLLLALAVAAAWLALARMSAAHPAASHLITMPAQPLNAINMILVTQMWLIMMIAMMLPTVLPFLDVLGAQSRKQDRSAAALPSSAAFLTGYLVIWCVYSVAAAALQLALQTRGLMDWRVGQYAGGGLLVLAGVYQLTPMKTACLRHCRGPLSFFLHRWRDGLSGALRMGISHGAYCLGCCWALMALAFTLGVMNLAWMAALTVFLCVEKIAPGGVAFDKLSGAALTGWGLVTLLLLGG